MRPIDIQNAVSRTNEIEKVGRVSEESSRFQQIAFAAELLRRKEQQSRQVNASQQAEGEQVQAKKDGHRRDPRQDARQAAGRGTQGRQDVQDTGDPISSSQVEPSGKGRIIDAEA